MEVPITKLPEDAAEILNEPTVATGDAVSESAVTLPPPMFGPEVAGSADAATVDCTPDEAAAANAAADAIAPPMLTETLEDIGVEPPVSPAFGSCDEADVEAAGSLAGSDAGAAVSEV